MHDPGKGCEADQWDLAGSGTLYFVNILINSPTSVLQSLYGPSLRGRHVRPTGVRESERERENKSPLSLLKYGAPQGMAAKLTSK